MMRAVRKGWARLAVAALVASVLIAGCSGHGEDTAVSEQQATWAWQDRFGSDCYAPRDIGTSAYPLDRLEKLCVRTLLEKAERQTDGTYSNLYCFTYLTQATWAFSDDPGFGDSGVTRQRDCFPLFPPQSGSAADWAVVSSPTSSQILGKISNWP